MKLLQRDAVAGLYYLQPLLRPIGFFLGSLKPGILILCWSAACFEGTSLGLPDFNRFQSKNLFFVAPCRLSPQSGQMPQRKRICSKRIPFSDGEPAIGYVPINYRRSRSEFQTAYLSTGALCSAIEPRLYRRIRRGGFCKLCRNHGRCRM